MLQACCSIFVPRPSVSRLLRQPAGAKCAVAVVLSFVGNTGSDAGRQAPGMFGASHAERRLWSRCLAQASHSRPHSTTPLRPCSLIVLIAASPPPSPGHRVDLVVPAVLPELHSRFTISAAAWLKFARGTRACPCRAVSPHHVGCPCVLCTHMHEVAAKAGLLSVDGSVATCLNRIPFYTAFDSNGAFCRASIVDMRRWLGMLVGGSW